MVFDPQRRRRLLCWRRGSPTSTGLTGLSRLTFRSRSGQTKNQNSEYGYGSKKSLHIVLLSFQSRACRRGRGLVADDLHEVGVTGEATMKANMLGNVQFVFAHVLVKREHAWRNYWG